MGFVPCVEVNNIHIPDKHFKMIRYYGIYHPSVSRSDFVRNAHLIPAIHPSKRPFLRSLSRGTVKYYAQIRLQIWQNSVCTGQGNLPLIIQ